MQTTHVPGKNKGKIMVYALSTCPWCRKMKQFLNEKGIEYEYIDVDLLQGDERSSILSIVEEWNPQGSFPTIVINDSQCIIGYDETKMREALRL